MFVSATLASEINLIRIYNIIRWIIIGMVSAAQSSVLTEHIKTCQKYVIIVQEYLRVTKCK